MKKIIYLLILPYCWLPTVLSAQAIPQIIETEPPTPMEFTTDIQTGVATNDCQNIPIVLTANEVSNYQTNQTISSSTVINAFETISYTAQHSITLSPGFHAQAGSVFSATIASCESCSSTDHTSIAAQRNEEALHSTTETVTSTLQVYPNPFAEKTTVHFQLGQSDPVFLGIYDNAGRLLKTVLTSPRFEAGVYELVLTDAYLYKGLFYAVLRTSTTQLVKKIVVI